MSIIETAHQTSQQPTQRSLNSQYVLDEDEYTAALSHIIARDFFPSLVHLDATNDYLDAVNTKDPRLIQASVRRLQELSDTPVASSSRGSRYFEDTPAARTPWGTGLPDTPLHTPRVSSEPPNKKAKFDTSLSLDVFQARYTSEDNSSFTQILDEENRQRRDRYGWAWDAQKRVEVQNMKIIEGRERMLVEPPPQTGVREKSRIEAPVPKGLLTDGESHEEKVRGKKRKVDGGDEEHQGEMALIVREDEERAVDVMAPRKDTREAGVEGWKFRARNSFMFPPDADVSPYHQPAQKDPEKHSKVIKYGNTRLPEQEDSGAASRSTSAPPSPTRSRIDAAIEGISYQPKLKEDEGFTLVPNVPSPTPAELGPSAMKQLTTWGTMTATPRIIQSDDDNITPDNPFRIAQMSKREEISRRLSNNASKSLREKAEMMGLRTPGIVGRTPVRTPLSGLKKGGMAPPSWTPRRADAPGNLTPAARRLLERSTLGTAASRRADAMERAAEWDGSKGKERDPNQFRWTPTPGRR